MVQILPIRPLPRLVTAALLTSYSRPHEGTLWDRHVIAAGSRNQTVIGAGFTGDGSVDIMSADAGSGGLDLLRSGRDSLNLVWLENKLSAG